MTTPERYSAAPWAMLPASVTGPVAPAFTAFVYIVGMPLVAANLILASTSFECTRGDIVSIYKTKLGLSLKLSSPSVIIVQRLYISLRLSESIAVETMGFTVFFSIAAN